MEPIRLRLEMPLFKITERFWEKLAWNLTPYVKNEIAYMWRTEYSVNIPL